jgi:hypothetical protein
MFLNAEDNKPGVTDGRRDAQSVTCSANSRRRRRSHTPSSASVVGGKNLEELQLRRRSRSIPAGELDRAIQERRKSSRTHEKSGGEMRSVESSRRRDPCRDTCKESTNQVELCRQSPNPAKPSSNTEDVSRSRTRAVSTSVTRTPTKASSARSVKPSW